MYASAGIREGGELLQVPAGTTVNWFSVDSAGNVERNYMPNGKGKNFGKGTHAMSVVLVQVLPAQVRLGRPSWR